jgi:hypothetical protein
MTVFLDGTAFTSGEQLHSELAFKLGLPDWYGRNFDALLDCLSSIDDPHESLCAHWQLQPGKRMVLQIRGFSEAPANEELLKKFAQTVAAANERLTQRGRGIRIWIEFA